VRFARPKILKKREKKVGYDNPQKKKKNLVFGGREVCRAKKKGKKGKNWLKKRRAYNFFWV